MIPNDKLTENELTEDELNVFPFLKRDNKIDKIDMQLEKIRPSKLGRKGLTVTISEFLRLFSIPPEIVSKLKKQK